MNMAKAPIKEALPRQSSKTLRDAKLAKPIKKGIK